MARIPGVAKPVAFNKTDIIQEHVSACIQMVSVECNCFSVHTVAMACRDLVQNLAEHRGIHLDGDYRLLIKNEHHAEYQKIAKKAYNYFKHADRDAEVPYDGPSQAILIQTNDMQTLLNILGFRRLGGNPTEIMKLFSSSMSFLYPQYFKMEFIEGLAEFRRQFSEFEGDRSVTMAALRSALFQRGYLPSVPHA